MVRKKNSRKNTREKGVKRRHFLIGGGAAAGLVIAWLIWPRSYVPNVPAADNEEVFGVFLKISREGQIVVIVPQCEMGQGAYTVLPQILADELGADWRTIAVQPASQNPLYANDYLAADWAETLLPVGQEGTLDNNAGAFLTRELAMRQQFMVTADSSMLPAFAGRFREAGAAARTLLCKAAAARWEVSWESCDIENGFVVHEDKRIRLGSLVVDAAKQELPDPVPLRPNAVNNLVGQDIPRLDTPAKLDGSANFAGDVRLLDMVYASIRHGPIGDSSLSSYNRQGAADITALVDVVRTDDWIAAIASNWWAANRALDKMSPVFKTEGPMPDSAQMDQKLSEAIEKGPAKRFVGRGNLRAEFEAHEQVQSIYQLAPAMRAPIETPCATAEFKDGRLRLWMATQAPMAAVRAAARALNIAEENVALYPMFAGGSFGQRLDGDVAAEAAILANKLNRPVQLMWSRAETLIRDPVRPPARAKLDAAVDKNGRIKALQIKIASPAAAREQSRRVVRDMDPVQAMQQSKDEPDIKAVSGAEPPYAIANLSVDHHPAHLGLFSGSIRANANGGNAFCTESFIDELAHRANVEPLTYRMSMMSGRPRLARCLRDVATMTGWDGGVDNSGQGIACHTMHGGFIAVVVQASRGTNGVRVRQMSAIVDIGRIIHPDIARQQIEGGMMFGLAMALGTSSRYREGRPNAKRLRDLLIPDLAQTPDVRVEFIRSEEEPAGYEELGVPAVPPAIANALFSATGYRSRRLPLFSEGS